MKKLMVPALIVSAVVTMSSCAAKDQTNQVEVETTQVATTIQQTNGVHEITSVEEFNQIAAQEDRLLVFDLYADWCGPCKMLAPILEKVAQKYNDRASFYKIDTEDLPSIAQLFRVEGIPYVVFFKDGAIQNALTGLYPEESYSQAVEFFSENLDDTAHGELVDGKRNITIISDQSAGNIFGYRGDHVKLTVEATGEPFTIILPDFDIEASSDGSENVELSVEIKELGLFSVVLSDDSGRNDRLWLAVMQYQTGEASYREVGAQQFAEAITEENTLLLDVRTEGEYNRGHIEGATLIPVEVLANRVGELYSAKDKTILLYCRSGNRSTVAANILKEAGFTSLVNLSPGIRGWERAGLTVVK